MAPDAFRGPFANGTESNGWAWLMQQLAPPCYQIYIPLYQGDHTARPKHPFPPLPYTEVLRRQRKILAICLGILNTRQCGQRGDDGLFCRRDEHFRSAVLGTYSRFETFGRTGLPVPAPYSSGTTSSTRALLDGNTGALSQPVSLAWGNQALCP